MIGYAVALGAIFVLSAALLWAFALLESGRNPPQWALILFDTLLGYGNLISTLALLLFWLLCVFLYCRFTYRAMKNLHLSRARGELMSPGWAVMWNFIPFANLWQPRVAMVQIWRSSHDPEKARAEPPPGLNLWWFTWIAANILSQIAFRMTSAAGGFGVEITDFELFKMAFWVDMASYALGIASVVFVLPIIRGVTQAQDARTPPP